VFSLCIPNSFILSAILTCAFSTSFAATNAF
jgi:hypothetical protein